MSLVYMFKVHVIFQADLWIVVYLHGMIVITMIVLVDVDSCNKCM